MTEAKNKNKLVISYYDELGDISGGPSVVSGTPKVRLDIRLVEDSGKAIEGYSFSKKFYSEKAGQSAEFTPSHEEVRVLGQDGEMGKKALELIKNYYDNGKNPNATFIFDRLGDANKNVKESEMPLHQIMEFEEFKGSFPGKRDALVRAELKNFIKQLEKDSSEKASNGGKKNTQSQVTKINNRSLTTSRFLGNVR